MNIKQTLIQKAKERHGNDIEPCRGKTFQQCITTYMDKPWHWMLWYNKGKYTYAVDHNFLPQRIRELYIIHQLRSARNEINRRNQNRTC